jgi:hypothetical protein
MGHILGTQPIPSTYGIIGGCARGLEGRALARDGRAQTRPAGGRGVVCEGVGRPGNEAVSSFQLRIAYRKRIHLPAKGACLSFPQGL